MIRVLLLKKAAKELLQQAKINPQIHTLAMNLDKTP